MTGSIAGGLVLIGATILLGIIWHLSRKIDHLHARVDQAENAAETTLAMLVAHCHGINIPIIPLRETDIEQ